MSTTVFNGLYTTWMVLVSTTESTESIVVIGFILVDPFYCRYFLTILVIGTHYILFMESNHGLKGFNYQITLVYFLISQLQCSNRFLFIDVTWVELIPSEVTNRPIVQTRILNSWQFKWTGI